MRHTQQFLRGKNFKQLAGILIMLATLVYLVYYWRTHPGIVDQLRSVSLATVVMLLALYAIMTLVLVGIYDTILRLCAKPIPLGEHALLTIYSSIINFFGPLQSGPGFRTVYLKRRHGVPVRDYVTGTLLYYGLFGLFNLLLLAAGVMPLRYALLLLLVPVVGIYAARSIANAVPSLKRFRQASKSPLLTRLAGLTFLQAALVVAIYSVELQSVGVTASFGQQVAYAGAGSLALFVSITPGALGFRESFQYFSQSIHHIDGQAIIAANVLDRSVYIIFLGLLFVITLAFHAQRRLRADD